MERLDPVQTPFSGSNERILYSGKAWNAILAIKNQSNLGSCIIYYKLKLLDDPLAITKEEQEELWFDIMPQLVAALRSAFHPDRFNYLHLANVTQHVHWQIVPRYEKKRERIFAGERFYDKRAGMSFQSVPEKNLSHIVLEKIQKEIQKFL